LTFCSDHRKEVFTSDERVECARSEILRTCMERHFAVPAGVFMPDHLHLLLRGLDNDSSLKDCMKVVRQRSSRAFKSAFEERLWQEGYFDHIVRDADNEREVIRYIVENPVRAGLCKGAEDYRYSWWPGHEMGLADVRGAEL
jgi:REP element-mobilizing transposase RayT